MTDHVALDEEAVVPGLRDGFEIELSDVSAFGTN